MFFANAAKAQYVNIPDSNFRAFLKTKYPSCFNSAGMMDTNCTVLLAQSTLVISSLFSNINNVSGLEYFKNIRTLSISTGSIKIIPVFPKKLNTISLFGNVLLNNLPPFPDSLVKLTIYNLPLLTLPVLPSTLTYLSCKLTNITTLPILPNHLQYLVCGSNKIKNIPNLPNSLRSLLCGNNQIISLPNLTDSLYELNINLNQFNSLPKLPSNLKKLSCGINNFSIIHNLPPQLIYLDVNGPGVMCLPELPNTLKSLGASFGSGIYCLPNYPDSCTYWDNGNYSTLMPPVDLCNPTNNPSHCQAFPVIQSNIFIDNNFSGIKDSGEIYKKKARGQLSNSNYTFTNSNGQFQIAADSLGAYTLTIIPPPFYSAVPSTINLSFSSYDTLVNLPDIALQPNTLKDSLSIVATPVNFAARPGFKYAYNIQYENIGTTFLSPNINFSYDNSLLTYDSSSNNSVVNNGSSLNLSQGIFAPGQTVSFTAYFRVRTTAVLGTDLLAVANISAGNCNNVDSITTTIRGSYDPNDKNATPTLTLQDVVNKKYINYTIRFQNTGTDTAFNVVIADTLSTFLKTNNLQGVTSSHPCKTTIKNGVVYFEFIDINLPDSNTNKLGSNGFVKFKILADESVVAGTVIPNKAYIYFDYNKAIITNIATTTIQNPLPLTLVNFGALPKPLNEISVYWTTANEINTKYFIIETSTDGISFKPAAELAAIGFGDNSYSYSITSVSLVYIRLKIVDKDGKVAYSKIIKISETKNSGITISPNPAKNYLNITVNKMDFSNTKSNLINSVGMVVKSFILKSGTQFINISDLAIGVYYLQTGVQTIKVFVEK